MCLCGFDHLPGSAPPAHSRLSADMAQPIVAGTNRGHWRGVGSSYDQQQAPTADGGAGVATGGGVIRDMLTRL